MNHLKVYLAGPDVFLADALEVGRRKVALCERYGFTGCFPLDNEVDDPSLSPRDKGYEIYHGNSDMMRGCDAILANLSPFRGPSADVGTVFEVGFFAGMNQSAALPKPIFAYSNDERTFLNRTLESLGLTQDATADHDGLAIERFDLPDNLMLPGAIHEVQGQWISHRSSDLAAWEAFERALQAMKISLLHSDDAKARAVG